MSHLRTNEAYALRQESDALKCELLKKLEKVKEIFVGLEKARGSCTTGTALISLFVRPTDEIPSVRKMLADEIERVPQIRSRVNRHYVLKSLTTVQETLKLFDTVPRNGIIFYCGAVGTDDGKERFVNIHFEPFTKMDLPWTYSCDDKIEGIGAYVKASEIAICEKTD